MEYTSSPMKDPKSYLTREQIQMLIDNAENERDGLLLKFLSMTGRRVSEVVRRLKVGDIDFTQGLVNFFIEKRKTPTYSLLPIPESLLIEVKSYIERNNLKPDSFLWQISRQRVDQIIKSIAKKVGLLNVGIGKYNKIHIHLFRHSFAIQASKVLKSPADLIQLKNILAHSRIETTMFYLKFNPTEQKELLKEMFG